MAKSNSNKNSEVKGNKVEKKSYISTKLTREVGRASTSGGGKPKTTTPKKK